MDHATADVVVIALRVEIPDHPLTASSRFQAQLLFAITLVTGWANVFENLFELSHASR